MQLKKTRFTATPATTLQIRFQGLHRRELLAADYRLQEDYTDVNCKNMEGAFCKLSGNFLPQNTSDSAHLRVEFALFKGTLTLRYELGLASQTRFGELHEQLALVLGCL